jgi:hypothetical protein
LRRVIRRLALYAICGLFVMGCERQEPSLGDVGSDREWDAEQRDVLSGADFPVFAPEGLSVELGSWGGGEGEPVESLSLVHSVDERRSVEVDTALDTDEINFDDEAAAYFRDDDGTEVGFVAASRSMQVDGVERPFAFASAGDGWIARGHVGSVTITVQARGIDAGEVKLRALADPSQVIGGTPKYRPHRPDFDVLDTRRVVELADSTPLKDVGPKLAGVAQGAIALLPTGSAQPSWIGGEPELPDDTRWPEGKHGAMLFLAQLSLADLAPTVWTGPKTGHLHIFCDADPESLSIEGAGACTVLHSPAGAELRPRRFPSDLHEDKRLVRDMVKPSVGLTLPDAWTPLMKQLGIELGDDSNLQTDALDGELYVALPAADLAAGRFDRAEATIEYD